MIKLICQKEVNEKHRFQCPHCEQIIDLVSKIQISAIPGGFHFSVKLGRELQLPKKLTKGIFPLPLEIGKPPTEKLEI